MGLLYCMHFCRHRPQIAKLNDIYIEYIESTCFLVHLDSYGYLQQLIFAFCPSHVVMVFVPVRTLKDEDTQCIYSIKLVSVHITLVYAANKQSSLSPGCFGTHSYGI